MNQQGLRSKSDVIVFFSNLPEETNLYASLKSFNILKVFV